MISLDDLRFVEALHRTGSMSAAARALNVTPPAISMRLKKLEAELGVNLVIRNSRHVRFTSEGERLVSEAQTLVSRVDALPGIMRADSGALTGSLRIVAPFGFGRAFIAPIIAEFSQAHPALHLDLALSENPWRANKDADVVIHIGELRDSSWVAHLIARNERWVCASPKYLAAHGMPTEPRQLLQHACLSIQENEEDVCLWRYRKKSRGRGKPGKLQSIRIAPDLKSNDGEVVRNWAITGLGCVLRSEWDAAPSIERGELKRILTGWEFEPAHVMALVSARRGISTRVNAFIGHLKKQFSPKPPWR
ncbi:MAG: LysR family transcriptional regulator [Rhizobiales bacterium]|nr:LysR family transcriptional regulator [Hyphomicrobiales bacterium]